MRFCGNCGRRLEDTTPIKSSRPRNESGTANLVETGSGDRKAPLIPTSTDQLGVMMGADLLDRFQKAGLESNGQRRNVTVLFVDLTGFTNLSEQLSNEDLYDLIQEFIRTLADDVYKYEGMVDKLTGDGLMALFGAPISYENNAERAIRSALDMQEDVRKLGQKSREKLGFDLQIHVGLNSGSVIVGGMGSNLIMNYTAIGDIVNLAKRLEESAKPGTILVSESVYRQTKPIFDFQMLPPLGLKGISHPVTAYQLAGSKILPGKVRGVEGLHAPLIGRENELGQLTYVADRLAFDQQGSLVLVVGEAGLGKSRLTDELKAVIQPGSIAIFEGHSLTYRKAIPFWIYQDVVRNILGVSLSAPAEEIRAKLIRQTEAIFGSASGDTLPYLEHLFSLKPSDTSAADRISFLDAGQLRQQIFLAVRNLLLGLAREKPVLLILEDLHWADETSLDLTLFLLDSIRYSPLVIYGISRPYEGGGLSQIVERARQRLVDRFVPIRLLALPMDQSKELLQSLLTVPEVPDSFKEQIIQRAAGVPFYLEEILRMLIENKVIVRSEGHWMLSPQADVKDLGVPDTLQDLILTRFDRLSPFYRQVLQTGSVIGNQFGADVLQAVLPAVSKEDTAQALADLVEKEYILPQKGQEATSPEALYIFKHVLVSDAIYSTLLQRDRHELHGRVGQAIEILYSNRFEGQIELLANHYMRSMMLDRALIYLLLAGQKAARGYANEQARQHYIQALGLLPRVRYSLDQLQAIHIGLGDVLVTIGEYQSARDHYQIAYDVIEEGSNSLDNPHWQEKSELLRKIATTFERQGDYDKTMLKLTLARAAIDHLDKPPAVECAKILNDIGWIYFRRGNLDQAEISLMEALGLAETTAQLDVVASIYNRLGGVAYQKGQFDTSSEFTHKSLELREKIGDIVAVARSYNNLGLLHWRLGDWDGALENFNRSYTLHTNLGDIEGMLELNTNLGLLQLDRGNIDEVKNRLEDILNTAQSIGHLYTIGLAQLHLSLLYLSIEDWQTALDYTLNSLNNFREIGVKDILVDVYLHAGQACLGLGDLDAAEKWGLEAQTLLQQSNPENEISPSEESGRIDRLMGSIAQKRGLFQQAAFLLTRSASIFNREGNQFEHARSQACMASLSIDRGQKDQALSLIQQSRDIFLKLGAKTDLRKLDALQV